MFPAGIFWLVVMLLDPRTNITAQIQLQGDMNYFQCKDLEMFMKDRPYYMGDGGVYIVKSVSCYKVYND